MKRCAKMVVAGLLAVLSFQGSARGGEIAPFSRVCMSASQARGAIAEHHLIESSVALGIAASKAQAEPLSGRLCRSSDEFVYEITLLRKDGRVIYSTVDALSGRIVRTQNSN